MSFVNTYDIKKELMNFLRNQNVISTSNRGVTTITDNFVATAGQTNFVLSQSTLKNVRSVTVNAASKTYGIDYSINFQTYTVTLNVASTLSDAVAIQFDYGTSDKIFPDYPQKQIKMSSLPRIAFDVLSGESVLNSVGEVTVTSKLLLSANIYDVDYKSIEDVTTSVRNVLNTNAKSFYSFNFIKPIGIGPLITTPFGEDKVLQRTADFEILILNEG